MKSCRPTDATPTPRSAEASSGGAPKPLVAVAFSGGRDSTALLHATVQAARAVGIEVVALHINHRLMPDADAWQARAQSLCARWARRGAPLRFEARVLAGQPARGESVEAWARNGRYAALGALARAQGASMVLLGHHRRDQAETFVLQALRGGGPAGLAAMPASIVRGGLVWARPWLAQPRDAIDAYVRRHRLATIEDPSNADIRHARNRLRGMVMPALSAAFPHAEQSLVQAAAASQEAAAALAELAGIDLASCTDERRLMLGPWLALSPARRGNALRHWLRQVVGKGAPASLVARLLAEWPAQDPAGRGRAAHWPLGTGWLRGQDGALEWRASRTSGSADADVASGAEVPLSISGPGDYRVAVWRGVLQVRDATEGGVVRGSLAAFALRARVGGERFQMGPGRPARALKKQYQAAGVRADARGVPLGFIGDQLVYVPGLGVDARMLAEPGVPQWGLQWLADAAGPVGAAGAPGDGG